MCAFPGWGRCGWVLRPNFACAFGIDEDGAGSVRGNVMGAHEGPTQMPMAASTLWGMNESMVVALLVGILLGAALGWWIGAKTTRAGQVARRGEELAHAHARVEALEQARVISEEHWRERVVALEERILEQARIREQERADRARRELQDHEEQSQVLEALAPVHHVLGGMQSALSDMERQRQHQYGALAEQLRQASENDLKLRQATTALEAALRNTKVRGAWGEAQLRNIVESAGLLEHIDFTVQTSMSTQEGRLRPDMVLRLPGGKTLPIDAKVPFNSYIEAMEIAPDASGAEGRRREDLLGAHVKALRQHIDALAKRSYWSALEDSPDFVIAFIPAESLLSAALDADPSLLDYAFAKKVALASPVTLWSVMRTVAYAWQQEVLTAEAKELFDLSRDLYDRLAVLGRHADSLRSALVKSVESWNSFAGSLENRVFITARKLQRLDATTTIPQAQPIDTAPRLLTAAEMTNPRSA